MDIGNQMTGFIRPMAHLMAISVVYIVELHRCILSTSFHFSGVLCGRTDGRARDLPEAPLHYSSGGGLAAVCVARLFSHLAANSPSKTPEERVGGVKGEKEERNEDVGDKLAFHKVHYRAMYPVFVALDHLLGLQKRLHEVSIVLPM